MKTFFRQPHRAINAQKKLIIIALDWTRPKDPPSSLGHASIIANLNAHHIQPIQKSWSVNHSDFNVNEVVDYILSQNTKKNDLAIGAFVWNEPYVQNILKVLKQKQFAGRIILGGPQISYVKENLESYYPHAHVFIRGYAEDALLKLIQSNESNPIISGVHYAGEPDLGLSANTDIEQLPSPYLNGIIKPQSFIRWETQRGCPFRCSFCQHRESDVSMTRRQLSQSRIMQEIDWIIAHPIINDIAVLDPTFNSGSNYLEILHRFLDKGFTGKLSLQCRMEMVSKEFLDVIEELNKMGTTVLEFGLQTIHKNEQRVIQRPNNMKQVERVLAETKKRNIPIEVSLIFGLPQQTVESFKASIDFCKAHEVPVIYAFPLMLLRGTPLDEQKQSLGLLESSDINLDIPRIQQAIPHVISSPTFSYEEWQEMASLAESLDNYNASMRVAEKRLVIPKMKDTLNNTLWKKTCSTAIVESSRNNYHEHFDDSCLRPFD